MEPMRWRNPIRVVATIGLVAACSGQPSTPTTGPAASPTATAAPSAVPASGSTVQPASPATTYAVTQLPTVGATPAASASPATSPLASEIPGSPLPTPVAGACSPGTGPTIHSASAGAPETWTAAQSPHVVPNSITVNSQLIIEPCAEVRIAPRASITVSATGSIVANGDSAHHIVITADQPGARFLNITAHGGGTLHLAFVDISSGGDPGNTQPSLAGTIFLQGIDGTQPTQPILFVDNVSVSDSGSTGIVLRDGAGFAPGSTALTVTGSVGWPVSVWARAAGTLPVGNYLGNANDQIILSDGDGGGSILEDTTVRNLGVPYLIGTEFSHGGLRVTAPFGSTDVSTLTVEPGVTLLFRESGILEIEHFTGDSPALGALVAVGTPDQPIVFTSAAATPAPGDWYGLRYGLVPSDLNRIDYASIEYTGAVTGVQPGRCKPATRDYLDGSAVLIYGKPPGEFITNTTIFASAGHGVARAWLGKKIDFKATNTFEQVAGCDQT